MCIERKEALTLTNPKVSTKKKRSKAQFTD